MPKESAERSQRKTRAGRVARSLGIVAAPLMAAVTYLALPDAFAAEQGEIIALTPAAHATAAVAVWMAIWWVTEAIPIYATALLPLALFPLFGVASMREASSPYSHPLIYLFMGGFILALSMQRWGLDRRISLYALRLAGTQPAAVIGAFMGVTALLSMWVSNTATAVMMLPVALGVIELAAGRGGAEGRSRSSPTVASPFATCLLLGIAYAASIGGVGTIVGTPPNLFLASFAESNLGIEISFVRWMAIGVPLVAVFLPLTWLLLTRVLHPVGREPLEGGPALLGERLSQLGPMKRGEWVTFVVFTLTAFSWIMRPWLSELEVLGTRPLAGLTDSGIAMIAALSLFLIPADPARRVFTMDWETATRLPWGLLILFGGGLSLAAAIRVHGVGEYIGSAFGSMHGVAPVFVILGVVTLMIFLTEITSNTATAATMLPILASLAPAFSLLPMQLIVPAAIAASCAFMLPVATPPNAVVFGSGRITVAQMARAGLGLNLLGIVLITGICYALVVPLLGAAG